MGQWSLSGGWDMCFPAQCSGIWKCWAAHVLSQAMPALTKAWIASGSMTSPLRSYLNCWHQMRRQLLMHSTSCQPSPPVTVIVCFSPLACALHGAIQLCRRLPPFVPICLPISVLLVLLRVLEPSLDEEGDLVRRDMAW